MEEVWSADFGVRNGWRDGQLSVGSRQWSRTEDAVLGTESRGIGQAEEAAWRDAGCVRNESEVARRGATVNCAHRRDGLSIYGRFLENSRRWSKGALEHLRTPEVNIYGKFLGQLA